MKFLDLRNAHLIVLCKSSYSSDLNPKQFFRSYRLIARSYVLYRHVAVPDLFWSDFKQFYPNESPFLRIKGGLPGIPILTTPYKITKNDIASSPVSNILSFCSYLRVFML